ncbi:HipA family kinase [Haloferula sp. BvORR071]|uniref:HipA family kinase n=1 Tax=Haloferula sp. BvORR071 TaxID=1396141 RepID=UPI0005548713|nr:HipA family kinase [Haloferula sp. BvORR071]
MRAILARFIETFRGSSFPTLSETRDGEQVVIKMRGAGNGAGALLSEFLVNRFAHLSGLPVPDVRIVEIAADHPWEFGTDEFDDLLQKSPGANLGICWIPEAAQLSAEQAKALPEEFISQVVTLDLVFANLDRSAASCNLLRDSDGRRWIIDHGGCRFLFRRATAPAASLPEDHIFQGREDLFDMAWLKPLTRELVEATLAEVPDSWLAEEGFTREEIGGSLALLLASR